MVATHFILQSSDGVDILVERSVLEKSVLIKDMIGDLGAEKLSEPIQIHIASAKVLQVVLRWCQFHTDDPSWDQAFINSNREILKELIITANYLDISELLHIGCRTIASMIKGRMPSEIRAILKIQPYLLLDTATVAFRDLPTEMRQICYEYLDLTAQTLITFQEAVEGREGDEDIFREFTEWTSHLLAIVSPNEGYLNRLVPGADVAMWRPGDDTLCCRVRDLGSPWSKGFGWVTDHSDLGSPLSKKYWRLTHHSDLGSVPFLTRRIEVDNRGSLLLRMDDDIHFLVLCKRADLVDFSRNWMMVWPVTGFLYFRPCGSILDLDRAMNLFKSSEPEGCYTAYDSTEYSYPGILSPGKILSLLNQVANQEWNGYPPKICLGHAQDCITSILRDHELTDRDLCGWRFENPLSTADREELERLEAEFDKMMEVMEKEGRREMRRAKAMKVEETRREQGD